MNVIEQWKCEVHIFIPTYLILALRSYAFILQSMIGYWSRYPWLGSLQWQSCLHLITSGVVKYSRLHSDLLWLASALCGPGLEWYSHLSSLTWYGNIFIIICIICWILVYPCVYIGSLYGFLIGKEYLLEVFRGLDFCMLYTRIRRNCKENHWFVKIISLIFYFVFK